MADAMCVLRAAGPITRQCSQELGQQQRVSGGRLEAGADERILRLITEPGADHPTHCASAQSAGAQRPCRGRGGQRSEDLLLGPALVWPGADRHQDGDVLDATREHVQESQAGRVSPMDVIDDDQQRILLREVGGQPEQAVQARM